MRHVLQPSLYVWHPSGMLTPFPIVPVCPPTLTTPEPPPRTGTVVTEPLRACARATKAANETVLSIILLCGLLVFFC